MTKMDSMTAERFQVLLEAYGAEIARWPETERFAAHTYAEATPEAAALLAEARELDALLAALRVPTPPASLEAAILAAARTIAPVIKSQAGAVLGRLLDVLWPRASFWKPASVFVSALVLGALIGVNLLDTLVVPDTADTQREDVLAYAVPYLAQDLN
jgi:hypothetical protein